MFGHKPDSEKTVTARPCRAYADPTYSGRERITCDCGKTLVRQPYMTYEQWAEARKNFLETHGDLTPPNANMNGLAPAQGDQE